jgi:ABC-2 type transport system permease protein
MIILIRWLSRRLRARRAAGRPDAAAATRQASPPRGGKGPLSQVAHQIHYNLIPLTRNRQGGLVATIGFPLIFLVLFVAVFGNHPVGPDHVNAATYYVPGIAALAVVVASFTNPVTALVSQRESGILRRRRATPVPAQALIAAQAVTTLLVSLAGVAVLLGIGQLAYRVTLQGAALPGVLLNTLVGSVAFTCLAYALSTAVGSVDSATPTVQAISLPLYFISGIFIPNANLPPWLQDVAKAFPVQHLADGLHHAFDPAVHGGAVAWTDLAVLAAWAAAGLAVALRRFSWSPSTASTPPDDRRSARGPGGHAGRLGWDPEPGRVEVSRSTPAWPPSRPIPSAGQQQPQGPTAEGASGAATPQGD